jgi:hypothetical protein
MKKWAVLFAVTMTVSGCSWFSGWFGDEEGAAGGVTKESVSAAIASAEAASKKAAAAGGDWRDMEKMQKDAKAALEKGELEKALKMAQEAEAQSKLAEQQATDNKAAKPWLF